MGKTSIHSNVKESLESRIEVHIEVFQCLSDGLLTQTINSDRNKLFQRQHSIKDSMYFTLILQTEFLLK